MTYDGTGFVGIDEDALGDGTGDSTQVVDCYLQQGIENNARWLNAGQHEANCVFVSGNDALTATTVQGDRCYGAVRDWCYPLVIPWLNVSRLESIKFRPLYRVANENTGTPTNSAIGYKLVLTERGLSRNLASTQDEQAETDYAYGEISLDLPASYVGSDYVQGALKFAVLSQDAGDTATNLTLTGLGSSRAQTAANGDIALSDPSPDSTSPETQFIEKDDADDDDKFDLIGMRDNGSAVEDVWLSPAAGSFTADDYNRHWMTYMQIRSVGIEPQYSKPVVGLETLGAKRIIRGQNALQHAASPDITHERPKLLSFGPGGYRLGAVEWPSSMAIRWPIADAAGNVDTLVNDIVLLDRESGRVDVLLYLIPTMYVSNNYMRRQDVAASVWDLTLDIEQFDTAGTDWSNATSLGTSTAAGLSLATHPTSAVATRYQLTKFLMQQAATTPTAWAYPFKEGMLFDEDLALIQPVRLSAGFSGLTNAETSAPVRLKVSASYTANSFSREDWLSATTFADLLDLLHLTCVGYSAWSLP